MPSTAVELLELLDPPIQPPGLSSGLGSTFGKGSAPPSPDAFHERIHQESVPVPPPATAAAATATATAIAIAPAVVLMLLLLLLAGPSIPNVDCSCHHSVRDSSLHHNLGKFFVFVFAASDSRLLSLSTTVC